MNLNNVRSLQVGQITWAKWGTRIWSPYPKMEHHGFLRVTDAFIVIAVDSRNSYSTPHIIGTSSEGVFGVVERGALALNYSELPDLL